MSYYLYTAGARGTFDAGHPLLTGSATDAAGADVIVVLGAQGSREVAALDRWRDKTAVLLEVGSESLGVYTGESRGNEGSNVLGFARFRLGTAEPTKLVEVVRQPASSEAALAAAKQLFESVGLQVAVCGDFTGRIVDRLVRPYYNAALRRLDEGLASADDLDTTLKLGLGYPVGPISLLESTGLAEHHDVTQALYEAYGDPAYAPARRARVAKQRADVKK